MKILPEVKEVEKDYKEFYREAIELIEEFRKSHSKIVDQKRGIEKRDHYGHFLLKEFTQFSRSFEILIKDLKIEKEIEDKEEEIVKDIKDLQEDNFGSFMINTKRSMEELITRHADNERNIRNKEKDLLKYGEKHIKDLNRLDIVFNLMKKGLMNINFLIGSYQKKQIYEDITVKEIKDKLKKINKSGRKLLEILSLEKEHKDAILDMDRRIKSFGVQ